MVQWHNQRGLASLGEYAVTFFLVTTAVVTMAVYIQRTLQGRLRDARLHMIEVASSQCDANCMKATGLPTASRTIGMQYEPYYAQVNALVNRASTVNHELGRGVGVEKGGTGIFTQQTNEQNQSAFDSRQLPPVKAKDDQVLGSQ